METTINQTSAKIFTPIWWDDFLSETSNLTQTTVFRDCLTKAETAEFRECVLEIIRVLAALRTNKFGYRVYLDGVMLDTNGMNSIYDSPPERGETLQNWVGRVFGDKKFGMIINMGEKFNLSLSQSIAIKVKPLFERIGFPRDGINFSLFVGNYDKTPLGIHRDKKGENVIHFHLGPGPKTMYTWSTPLYEALIADRKPNNKDIEPLLPYATAFTFGEGDLYYMPETEYHVGKQDGLSLSVTLWQYNHPKDVIAKKLMSVVGNQYFTMPEERTLTADRNSLDDNSGAGPILKCIHIPNELIGLSYPELLGEAYKDLRYSIHSNAGYRSTPFPLTEEYIFDPDDKLQIEIPYQMLYKESTDQSKLHLYVRGVKLEFNNYPCLKSLVDLLNTNRPITFSEALSTMDPTWDESIGAYILGLFINNHGLKRV